MPRQVFEYDPPERFVAGTTGMPGSRTFFLQARTGPRVTTVALEKQQVSVLAERVDELLDEVVRRTKGETPVPAITPAAADDTAPLELPIEEEFRVGTMGLAWDGDAGLVVVEAHAQTGDDDEEAPEPLTDAEDRPDVLRVRMNASAARAFISRATRVVAAGRPPCPLCGLPLDPHGHVCPRQNGFRR